MVDTYEKTMLRIAANFSTSEIFILSDKDIEGISELLLIDYDKLKKALKTDYTDYDYFCENEEEAYQSFNEYELFANIARFYRVLMLLKQISDKCDNMTLKENISCFQAIVHEFTMMNVSSATYECMKKNKFSFENTVCL